MDVIGHSRYTYIDGGLTAWRKMGFPLISSEAQQKSSVSNFSANILDGLLVSKEEVRERITDTNSIVWDARAPEEFNGTKITAIRNGHIPGAKNLDWLELQDAENDRRLKPLTLIAERLNELGISKEGYYPLPNPSSFRTDLSCRESARL